MQFTVVATLFSAATFLAAPIAALGINCRGSSMCHSPDCGSGNCIAKMLSDFNAANIPDDRVYANGEHIICQSDLIGTGRCAFLQKTDNGYPAGEIKKHWQDLINHGCTKCGSVPMKPGNNVKSGELTFNYVHSTKCNGVC